MDPVYSSGWSSCAVGECINNSKVTGVINGCIYILSEFQKYRQVHLKALRIFNINANIWSIPSFEQDRIIGIIGKQVLFRGNHNPYSNADYFACPLTKPELSNFLLEVPKWAIHQREMPLPNGKTVKAFWGHEKIEVWDDKGIIFKFDQYQISRETINGIPCIHESGIISQFEIGKDCYIVVVVNKTSIESDWEQYAVLYLGEFISESETYNQGRFPNREEHKEIFQTLFFNTKGEQIFEKKKGLPVISDEKIIFNLQAISRKMGVFYGGPWLLQTLIHETKNWIVGNMGGDPVISNAETGEILFSWRPPRGSAVEKLFFDKDRIGIIVYDCRRNQEESGFSYCSGPTVYDIDEEFRENYRIYYFNIDGSLLNVVELKDLKEYHDHTCSSVRYPRIISVNGNLIGKSMPDNSLAFENLDTRNARITLDTHIKEHNNRYLITTDFECFNLMEGLLKVCTISKPWVAAKLFGSYLAVIRPTNEVNIIDLDSGQMELREKLGDTPLKICGFSYKKADNDFLAVQYERYIKIWYRTAQENQRPKVSL